MGRRERLQAQASNQTIAPEAPQALQCFEVVGGLVRPLQGVDPDPAKFLSGTGHAYPSGDEVVTLPDGSRMAFFTKGTVRAWPIAGKVPHLPNAFTEEDIKALFGSYITYQMRLALTPDDGKWPKHAVVLLVGEVVLLLALAAVGYFAWQAYDLLKGLV